MSRRFEVDLPSGRTVTCVPVSAFNFSDIYGGEGDDDSGVTVRLICACTVDPKMAPYPEGHKNLPEGVPSLETELPDLADQMYLAAEIGKKSGVDDALKAVMGFAEGNSETESGSPDSETDES